MIFKRLLLALVFLGVIGCEGKSQYQYLNQPKSHMSDSTHKVKDLYAPEVDMLWVVDNSGSMSAYQENVATNLTKFIDALTASENLKWKIGLISTSIGEAPYLGFEPNDQLTYQDPDAADRFKKAISKLGTSGDSAERTYQPVLDILTKYPDFLRHNAFFNLILVSDAPEQSSNISTSDFVGELTKKVGNIKRVAFYGVLDPSDWCPSTDDPFAWDGSKFKELLSLVQGAAYHICDADYSNNLIDIAKRVASRALTSPRIYLESLPKIETIQVWYKDNLLPAGRKSDGGYWIYSKRGNVILFHDLDFAQGDDEDVRVTYQEDLPVP